MVRMSLIPSRLTISRKSEDWNWEPMSTVILEGTSHIFIQFSNIYFATVSAEITLMANVAGYRLYQFTMINI